MTVTYTHEVADCRGFGNFWRLLFRWKGSVYKLVWPDLLAYTFFYYSCSAVYRFGLDEDSKRIFEKVAQYCNYYSDLIPLSFVLGFYVSIVIQRWWAQYQTLPWPDSLALFISTSISGHDNRGRLMRRTIVRYINLAFTITLTMITPRVKKRFPTIDHLVEAGFMTANEKKIFQGISERTPHSVHFVPLVWAGSVVARARKENRIRDDFAVKTIIDEINNIRAKCGGLLSYDWISIPLVYTQVVTLAVYSFFLSTIMGRQFLDPTQKYPHNDLDFYFPVFSFLQFFFYMGWLKVAESLVNPFGEDDDDFEVNWLVDRNLTMSYMIVDEMHNEHPELIQDIYWDEVFPQELPYTIASEQYRRDPPMGSTANISIPEADQEFLPVLDEEDEDEEDAEKGTPKSFKKVASTRSMESAANSGRKNSVISFFQNRLIPRAFGGSSSSIHRSRPRLNRSASRNSERSSVKRNNTNASLQGSEIFRMSEESLINPGKASPKTVPVTREREGRNSPFYSRIRTTSENEDEPILIKIKRRETEGKELAEEVKDEVPKKLEIIEDDDETSETTPLTSGEKQPQIIRFKKKLSTASGFDVGSDKSNLGRSPSQCSIQTSIFFDGSGINDGDDEKEEKKETGSAEASSGKEEKQKEEEKKNEKEKEKEKEEPTGPSTGTNSLTRRIKSNDPETVV